MYTLNSHRQNVHYTVQMCTCTFFALLVSRNVALVFFLCFKCLFTRTRTKTTPMGNKTTHVTMAAKLLLDDEDCIGVEGVDVGSIPVNQGIDFYCEWIQAELQV